MLQYEPIDKYTVTRDTSVGIQIPLRRIGISATELEKVVRSDVLASI
eukprot:SAG11_NODE_315_length_10858_cov_14.578977_3_plen_47_part_00